jgi:hypothetical protein
MESSEAIQISVWSVCPRDDLVHYGQYCQCVTCLPIGYCVDFPCDDCDGPTEGCIPPGEDD